MFTKDTFTSSGEQPLINSSPFLSPCVHADDPGMQGDRVHVHSVVSCFVGMSYGFGMEHDFI